MACLQSTLSIRATAVDPNPRRPARIAICGKQARLGTGRGAFGARQVAARVNRVSRAAALQVVAGSFTDLYADPVKAAPKKVLVVGGGFIVDYLARLLVVQGHDVTIIWPGRTAPIQKIPDDTDTEFAAYKAALKNIQCDRNDAAAVAAALAGKDFQVVCDTRATSAGQLASVVDPLKNLEQVIYVSDMSVYVNSLSLLPHLEEDSLNYKMPKGENKLEAEIHLQSRGINYTILRKAHLIGPMNSSTVEEFFFHRIKSGRPIPIPGDGQIVTQVGHVKDLAYAVSKCVGNPKAANQVFNIGSDRYVTYELFARSCAKAMRKPMPQLVYYDPRDFGLGKGSKIPLEHFPFWGKSTCMEVDKALEALGLAPKFDLDAALLDSYTKDFGLGNYRKEPDFNIDDIILDFMKNKPGGGSGEAGADGGQTGGGGASGVIIAGITEWSVPAKDAAVAWLNTPEGYLDVITEAGSTSTGVVRLNRVCWLELTAASSPALMNPGQYEGRACIKILPNFTSEELTITATPASGCGEPVTRTYTREQLKKLGTGWVDISTGPFGVSSQGVVEVKVHAFRTGDWKSGILFDTIKCGAPVKPGLTSFTTAAYEATVAWLNTPEGYLTLDTDANSSSVAVVRLNSVCWLELTANSPAAGIAPGQYEGRARIKLLPGWSTDELNITATPALGAAVTRTYTRAQLSQLGNDWVEISTGPVIVEGSGPVEVKVHAFRTGDWKSGILFDEIKLA